MYKSLANDLPSYLAPLLVAPLKGSPLFNQHPLESQILASAYLLTACYHS